MILAHGGGWTTTYGQLSQITAVTGETVEQGEVIGYVGATGRATGPHLHLELHEKEYHYPAVIDPAAFLDARLGEQQAPAPQPQPEPAPAQDNQPDAYAAQAVAWAVAEGLLRGDDTGNLRLHEPVTRQDVVVLLHRMKDLA